MKALTLIVALFAIAGTAHAAKPWKNVADIDPAGAAECQYLGDVVKSKVMGLLWGTTAVKLARKKVRKAAFKMNATHVMWTGLESAGMVHTASAKAYLCPAAH